MAMFSTGFKDILERMLENVSSKYDKREGSVIYDALAPTAIEHQLLYIDMETLEKEMFADTASREYLIAHASERGVEPKEATAAIWQATFVPAELSISIGERFRCGDEVLAVTARVEAGVYNLTCESAGSAGNVLSGALSPVSYINGLRTATLTKLISAGTDEESTEEFRARYLAILRQPAASGNANDYYNWAMSVDGVGAAKVYPLADGAGTVTVVIMDEDKHAAGTALVSEVYEYIETVRPVGAKVTVKSAEELAINISATITMGTGENLASIKNKFANTLTEYLESVAYSCKKINLSMIGKLLLDTEGVEDYTGLTINGSEASADVADTQVAVLGTITLEVSA